VIQDFAVLTQKWSGLVEQVGQSCGLFLEAG
jgi:hypothetical protein